MSEGYPVVRRFVIRRHPVTGAARFPWAIRDRNRPSWLGHAPTLARAIAIVDARLAEERGIPTRRDIREAMELRRVNAPCMVEPILDPVDFLIDAAAERNAEASA